MMVWKIATILSEKQAESMCAHICSFVRSFLCPETISRLVASHPMWNMWLYFYIFFIHFYYYKTNIYNVSFFYAQTTISFGLHHWAYHILCMPSLSLVHVISLALLLSVFPFIIVSIPTYHDMRFAFVMLLENPHSLIYCRLLQCRKTTTKGKWLRNLTL